MSLNGDTAEQTVHLALEGIETSVKISGTAARETVFLLSSALRQEKTEGKTRIKKLLNHTSELKVFSLSDPDLKIFAREARKYGLLYAVLKNKGTKETKSADLFIRKEDLCRVKRILEKNHLSPLDPKKAVSEKDQYLDQWKQNHPVPNQDGFDARPDLFRTAPSEKMKKSREKRKKSVFEDLEYLHQQGAKKIEFPTWDPFRDLNKRKEITKDNERD